MLRVHTDLLWIGNALELRQPRELYDAGIETVIDVAYEESPAQLPRQMVYCRFPINDGGGNPASILRQVVQTSLDLVRSDRPIVIGCSAGMSRSPAVAVRVLAALVGQSPDSVLNRLSQQYPTIRVRPDLWSDLLVATQDLSR